MLTQEEAAATMQMEVGVLQQQLSSAHDLVVEAQMTLAATQVWCFPTPCSILPSLACTVSVSISASTLAGQVAWCDHVYLLSVDFLFAAMLMHRMMCW